VCIHITYLDGRGIMKMMPVLRGILQQFAGGRAVVLIQTIYMYLYSTLIVPAE
jgi:hypothetical protein